MNAFRIGFGPPDGFLEAFANIYRDFTDAIAAGGGRRTGARDLADHR